jgi:hypothetical protein
MYNARSERELRVLMGIPIIIKMLIKVPRNSLLNYLKINEMGS